MLDATPPTSSLVTVLTWADDLIYAGLGAWMLQYMLDNPALAAALASGVVLLVRSLGYLAVQAAQYLQAKRLQIEAEIKSAPGPDAESALELASASKDTKAQD